MIDLDRSDKPHLVELSSTSTPQEDDTNTDYLKTAGQPSMLEKMLKSSSGSQN
jgi:hypothetical protein